MAAITICSDFGAPKNKVWHCFPIYFPWSDGARCHDLRFLNSTLKSAVVRTTAGTQELTCMLASLKVHNLKAYRQRTYSTFLQSSVYHLLVSVFTCLSSPSGKWVPWGQGLCLTVSGLPRTVKISGNKHLTKKYLMNLKNKLLSGQFWYEIFLVSIYIHAHFLQLLNLWLSIFRASMRF